MPPPFAFDVAVAVVEIESATRYHRARPRHVLDARRRRSPRVRARGGDRFVIFEALDATIASRRVASASPAARVRVSADHASGCVSRTASQVGSVAIQALPRFHPPRPSRPGVSTPKRPCRRLVTRRHRRWARARVLRGEHGGAWYADQRRPPSRRRPRPRRIPAPPRQTNSDPSSSNPSWVLSHDASASPFGSVWPWSTRETRAREEMEARVEACGYRRQGVDQPPDAVTAVAIAVIRESS